MEEEHKSINVSDLNRMVKDLLESQSIFRDYWIKGEVSGLKKAMSGHVYFTLKDEEGAISVAFFKSYAQGMDFSSLEGKEVLVKGRVSLYEKTGAYQLYGQKIEAYGTGSIYEEIEKRRERLRKEGLFQAERKKPLPSSVSTIGILTSATGAVIQDIRRVAWKRNPFTELVLWPVTVQGDGAPGEIIRGIEAFNRYGKADVLIIGRGGGSFEDLLPWSDEGVVRAVAASKIPIISAVGHETDHPLCDDAADLRGATPSQAAELATEDIAKRFVWLGSLLGKRLIRLERKSGEAYQELDRQMDRLRGFLKRGQVQQERLDAASIRLMDSFIRRIREARLTLEHLGEKLHLVSPLAILGRGYAVAYGEDGHIIRRAEETQIGDPLNLRLGEGQLFCRIEGKEEDE